MSAGLNRLPGNPLTCPELVELATEHLEGALDVHTGRRVAEHLAHCPDCPRYVRQLLLTIELSGRATDDALPEAARSELVELFARLHRHP